MNKTVLVFSVLSFLIASNLVAGIKIVKESYYNSAHNACVKEQIEDLMVVLGNLSPERMAKLESKVNIIKVDTYASFKPFPNTVFDVSTWPLNAMGSEPSPSFEYIKDEKTIELFSGESFGDYMQHNNVCQPLIFLSEEINIVIDED